MKIEISNGELLDKISILELKTLNIKDTNKLVNVYKELRELNPLAENLFNICDSDLQNHYTELAINIITQSGFIEEKSYEDY